MDYELCWHKHSEGVAHDLQGSFTGSGGSQLYYQAWRPEGAPRAAIVATHGMSDHSGGLAPIRAHLVSRGYAFYAHDLRGHGKSPGQRGHLERWSDLQADLGALVGLVRRAEPRVPLFLLGHSMGGLLTLDYALQHPETADGVVAIAPAVALSTSPWLMRSLGLLALVLPAWAISSKPNYDQLTRDPAALQRLAADKLRHGDMTPGLGSQLWRALHRTNAKAAGFKLPLLMLYGDADPITPAPGLGRFYAAAGSTDKEQQIYPGALHRPFEDLCAQEMLAHLHSWLDRHTE